MVIRPDGLPDLRAALYAMTVLRPRARSHQTLAQELYGVAALQNFAMSLGIDLEQRVAEGAFLALHEQTAYANSIAIAADGSANSAGTRAIRLSSGLRYLLWRARARRSRLRDDPDARDRLSRCAAEFAEEVRLIIPRAGSSERQGLDSAQLKGLVALLGDAVRLARLWPDPFVRQRNVTLVWCLLLLGHRVSELLALHTSDISFEDSSYRVQRRPDDPSDPRAHGAAVKGFSRDLDLPPEVERLLRDLVASRAALPFAAGHDFLITCHEGRPLSRSSVTKVFGQLRLELDFLPPDFSPHILRHCWNDAFSRLADANGLTEQQEIKARMLAMGWTSPGTARTYTRRHDRQAANAISLKMQDEYMEMAA